MTRADLAQLIHFRQRFTGLSWAQLGLLFGLLDARTAAIAALLKEGRSGVTIERALRVTDRTVRAVRRVPA
jgi:DNA-binding NarL/FixJ family response regulator